MRSVAGFTDKSKSPEEEPQAGFKSMKELLVSSQRELTPDAVEIAKLFGEQGFKSITEYQANRLNQQVGDLDNSVIDCKKCLNRGYSYVYCDANGSHFHTPAMSPCTCQKARTSLANGRKSGLSTMKEHRVANFKVTEEWQKDIKHLTADYILNGDKEWFLACGQSGAGKTMLCSAICNKRLEDGHEVIYILWRDYVARIKDSKFDKKRDNQNHYFEYCANAEILYIDDLFKGTITETDKSYAFELINHRYNKNLTTIVSTEMLITDLVEIDQAIAGRLKERAGKYCFQISKDIKKNYRFKEDKVV